MIIKKILNNNFVIAEDDQGEEVIVSGAGVGFRSQPGTMVRSNIEIQLYYLKSSDKERIYTIVENVHEDFLQLSLEIVNHTSSVLKQDIAGSTAFVLADHIMNAVTRQKNGQPQTPNLLLNEIKLLYPQEYELGSDAVQRIYNHTKVMLPDSEIGFITLHIVNGCPGQSAERAVQIAEITKLILLIVRKHFKDINTESVAYSRFITHLNFFANRVFQNDRLFTNVDASLYQHIFKDAFQLQSCVQTISKVLLENYDYEVSVEEELYLGLHLKRMVQ